RREHRPRSAITLDRRTPSDAGAGTGRAGAAAAGFGAGFGGAEGRAARGLAAGLARSPAAAGTEARATRLRRGNSATFVGRIGGFRLLLVARRRIKGAPAAAALRIRQF